MQVALLFPNPGVGRTGLPAATKRRRCGRGRPPAGPGEFPVERQAEPPGSRGGAGQRASGWGPVSRSPGRAPRPRPAVGRKQLTSCVPPTAPAPTRPSTAAGGGVANLGPPQAAASPTQVLFGLKIQISTSLSHLGNEGFFFLFFLQFWSDQ